MIRDTIALLGLLLLAAACTTTYDSGAAPRGEPRTRCLSPPQRSQDYTSDRPVFYFMCVESP